MKTRFRLCAQRNTFALVRCQIRLLLSIGSGFFSLATTYQCYASSVSANETKGEKLDAASVSTSLVRRVGIGQTGFVDKRAAFTGTPQNEALVQFLIEATSNIRQPH